MRRKRRKRNKGDTTKQSNSIEKRWEDSDLDLKIVQKSVYPDGSRPHLVYTLYVDENREEDVDENREEEKER